MRNMRLSNLKKRSTNYFKNVGVITPKDFSRKQIEYIVNRSYEALPKRAKKYIESREQISEVVVNLIMTGGEDGKVDAYQALKQYAEQRKVQKFPRLEFAKMVFKRFRQEYSSLYAKYNSYMYRQGYSSANYFYENAEWDSQGSIVTAILDLPPKSYGVVYTTLTITIDASGTFFIAEMQ